MAPGVSRPELGARRAAVGLLARAARGPAPAVAGPASASPPAAGRRRPAIRSRPVPTARWRGVGSSDRSFGTPQPPQRAFEILGDLLERQRQRRAPSDQHIV